MRYFCHFCRDGQMFEDVRGFHAVNDPEAIEVVRAIAHILLGGDRNAEVSGGIQLLSEIGKPVLDCSIAALVMPLQ